MGCILSCFQQTTMFLFGKKSNSTSDLQAKVERRLYLAKESPEPDFDLSDCELRQVPSGVFLYCRVYRKKNLCLQQNHLKSLDGGGLLVDLYLLKQLNISCNKFSRISNDIKYLVNLTELIIKNNLIEAIPEEIRELQCLKVLDVSYNRLKSLTPSIGQLNNLRKLFINENNELYQLCSELCMATNLALIVLDADNFVFPPSDITEKGTEEIMKYLCRESNIEYIIPEPLDVDESPIQSPSATKNPFIKPNTKTWEEHEAAIIEQENKYHEAAKHQRERFLSKVVQEQQELDNEIAKVQENKELERQSLLKAIQDDERDIEILVNKFIKSEYLKPEILQQQLAHDQIEHDRLLEIARQNYDNVKKSEVLKAMEKLIEEDDAIQYSKQHYENSMSDFKQSMLMLELEGNSKLELLLQAKDISRTVMVQQLLEDQDFQKALVASLIEKTDAKSWSLNEEISLISSHLAKLSSIEQEKKKLQISYNYNELLHQRVLMVNLLDDLLDQQSKRRQQLLRTLREMENDASVKTGDFWLKNYQKLIDCAPRNLLELGKHLDPVLANYLLEYGVIHCLPFLVKFLFSEGTLLDITNENLIECGITLSSDREGILKAINSYIDSKNHSADHIEDLSKPSAPQKEIVEDQNFTGVITDKESKGVAYESECVICMDAKCETVFVPCGHVCCCLKCSQNDMSGCPICRSTIERIIQIRVA